MIDVVNATTAGAAVYYILPNGTHLGFYNYTPPYEDAIEVPAPSAGDQVWDFATSTWGPSRLLQVQVEDAWRTVELPIARDNVTAIQFEDPDALPGTEAEWKAYWIAVKNWKEGNVNFPDITKRPVRPI